MKGILGDEIKSDDAGLLAKSFGLMHSTLFTSLLQRFPLSFCLHP
jgi:hypothetical protein